jgi:hypothetical protein
MLIKPVFIMLMFIRAERERDLHPDVALLLRPWLRLMEALSPKVLNRFMKVEHVMTHIPGIWNGIWSNKYVKTTFMRYGHGKGGIIGITLQPETLKTWALSLHICSKLEFKIFSDRKDTSWR